ncbi:MAG TPA: FHA domain-containing protein [Tepidisphaeraceae bacterium]|jgi:pSer/pThr/pTyr-binding forkhead associated (FHA) protein
MASTESPQPVRHEAQLIPLGSHAGSPPIPIKRPTTLIGSRQDIVRLHLQSSTVSKAHAVIVLNRWGCYIHDLSSRTKTWVNGKDVVEADLRDGDLIQIGRFKFKYVAPKNVTPKPAGDVATGELAVSTLSDPLALAKRVIQIGRRAGGDVQFDDAAVSNTHAILFRRDGALFVRDLSSRTGTWKDGKPVHEDRLDDGETLKIGAATLTYHGPAAADVGDDFGGVGVSAADTFAAMPGAAAGVVLAEAPQIDAPKSDVTDDDLDLLELDPEPSIASPAVSTPAPTDRSAAADAAVDDSLVDASTDSAPATDADIDAILGLTPPAAADDVLDVDADAPGIDEPAPGDPDDALAALRRDWRAKTPPGAGPDLLAEPIDLAPTSTTPELRDALELADLPPVAAAPPDVPADVLADAAPLDLAPPETADITDDAPGDASLELIGLDDEADDLDYHAGRRTPTVTSAAAAEGDMVDLGLDLDEPEPEPVEAPGDTALLAAEAARANDAEDRAADDDTAATPPGGAPVSGETGSGIAAEAADITDDAEIVVADSPFGRLVVVDEAGDDDGAIDLADAPPAPVAGRLAEPALEPAEDADEAADAESDVRLAAADDSADDSANDSVAVAGAVTPIADVPAELEALAESSPERDPESAESLVDPQSFTATRPAPAALEVLAESAVEPAAELDAGPVAREPELDAVTVETGPAPVAARADASIEADVDTDPEAVAAREADIVDDIVDEVVPDDAARAEAGPTPPATAAAADDLAAAGDDVLESAVEHPAPDAAPDAAPDPAPVAEFGDAGGGTFVAGLAEAGIDDRDVPEPSMAGVPLAAEAAGGADTLEVIEDTKADPATAAAPVDAVIADPITDATIDAERDDAVLEVDLDTEAAADDAAPLAARGGSPNVEAELSAIDLSAVDFDADTLDVDSADADLDAQDADDAHAAPRPVADLEAVDFSHLSLEPPAAPVAPVVPAAQSDETVAEPLLNLADSTFGTASPEAVDDDFVLDDGNAAADEAIAGLDAEIAELDAASVARHDAEPIDLETTPSSADRTIAGLDAEIDALDLEDVEDARPAAPAQQNGYHATMPASESSEALRDLSGRGDDELEFSESPDDASDDLGDDAGDESIPAPSGGSLSDLMPADGPLMGGAFVPQSGEWMLGGSPIMGLTGGNVDTSPAELLGLDNAVAEAPGAAQAAGAGAVDEKRRPLRVGFGADGRPRPKGSPFAGASGETIADFVGKRRASVDVFANPSPSAEDLADFGRRAAGVAEAPDAPVPEANDFGDLTGEQREILETAERFRPRGVRPQAGLPVTEAAAADTDPLAHKPSDLLASKVATGQAHDALQKLAAKRRRHLRNVLLCTLLLPILIGGAIAAIYYFLPPRASVETELKFRGLSQIGEKDQQLFRDAKSDLLAGDLVRQDAIAGLRPGVSAGFLNDRRALEAALAKGGPRWPADRPDTLRLGVSSVDPAADKARVYALASAFLKNNDVSADKYDQTASAIKREQARLAEKQTALDAAARELQELDRLRDTRPENDKIEAAAATAAEAEAAFKQATARRQNLEVEIERLRQQQQAGDAPPDTAATPAPAGVDDAQLKVLGDKLAAMRQRGEAVKASSQGKSAAAREALDATITQLQKELEAAQKLKDSPELSRYVTAAKQIFDQTRQLTDDLIRRQQQQHARLSEVKDKVARMMAEQLKQKLQSDKELKALNDELAILIRQQNAAKAQNMAKEAQSLDLKMQLLRSLIGGKEELLRKDPVSNEVVNALQRILEQTEDGIQQDRKNIDQALSTAQENFLRNAPAVEKLPEEQKQLAEGIEKRLQAVTEARKSFTTTADAAEAEQAAAEAKLKEEASSLQLAIAAREREVAAAARAEQLRLAAEAIKKQIAEKSTELAAVQQAEAAAKTQFAAAQQQVETYDALRKRIAATDARRYEKELEKQRLEGEISSASVPIQKARSELAGMIVPEPDFEIITTEQRDRRPTFAAIAGGAVFLGLLVPILQNLRLVARETSELHPEPPPHAAGFDPILGSPVDLDPPPADLALASAVEPEPADVR